MIFRNIKSSIPLKIITLILLTTFSFYNISFATERPSSMTQEPNSTLSPLLRLGEGIKVLLPVKYEEQLQAYTQAFGRGHEQGMTWEEAVRELYQDLIQMLVDEWADDFFKTNRATSIEILEKASNGWDIFADSYLRKVKKTLEEKMPEDADEIFNGLKDFIAVALVVKISEIRDGIEPHQQENVTRTPGKGKSDERKSLKDTFTPGRQAVSFIGRTPQSDLTVGIIDKTIKATCLEMGKKQAPGEFEKNNVIPVPETGGSFVLLDIEIYLKHFHEEIKRVWENRGKGTVLEAVYPRSPTFLENIIRAANIVCHPGTNQTRKNAAVYGEVKRFYYILSPVFELLSPEEKLTFARHGEMHIMITLGVIKPSKADIDKYTVNGVFMEVNYVNDQPGCDVRPILKKISEATGNVNTITDIKDTATEIMDEIDERTVYEVFHAFEENQEKLPEETVDIIAPSSIYKSRSIDEAQELLDSDLGKNRANLIGYNIELGLYQDDVETAIENSLKRGNIPVVITTDKALEDEQFRNWAIADARVIVIPEASAKIENDKGWFFSREMEILALLQASLKKEDIEYNGGKGNSLASSLQRLMTNLTGHEVSIDDLYYLLPGRNLEFLIDNLLIKLPAKPLDSTEDLYIRRMLLYQA